MTKLWLGKTNQTDYTDFSAERSRRCARVLSVGRRLMTCNAQTAPRPFVWWLEWGFCVCVCATHIYTVLAVCRATLFAFFFLCNCIILFFVSLSLSRHFYSTHLKSIIDPTLGGNVLQQNIIRTTVVRLEIWCAVLCDARTSNRIFPFFVIKKHI